MTIITSYRRCRYRSYHEMAKIERVVVAKPFRKHGIGRQLMQFIEQQAKMTDLKSHIKRSNPSTTFL